jgi:hypothetical protein
MPSREQHYFLYEASEIFSDSIAFEILNRDDYYREVPVPLLYLCRDLGEGARMLEEIVVYREESCKIGKMERTSDFFFQVQRTRLVSLDPLEAERKWKTFRKVVEAYNLGEVGHCARLSDYLEDHGYRMAEALHGGKVPDNFRVPVLPGGEKAAAELVNGYNQKVFSL